VLEEIVSLSDRVVVMREGGNHKKTRHHEYWLSKTTFLLEVVFDSWMGYIHADTCLTWISNLNYPLPSSPSMLNFRDWTSPMLNTDYDLKSSELQQISNANALAGMFAALGYDVDTRLTQTPEALGFPESLAREVSGSLTTSRRRCRSTSLK
jgi:hypothetical protein